MKSSDSLFLLIKSLTKAEKRHFKLDMGKYAPKGNKHYLRLFDAIDAQKVYDEAAIRKKFDGEPYFEQLARIKIYLNEQILKSLRNFHDEASSNMCMNNYLAEIEILFRKELHAECFETIRKAKDYAIKYEKLNYQLIIIGWEAIVADYNSNMEQIEQLKRTGNTEQQTVLAQCQEIAELRKLYLDSRYAAQTQGHARSQDEMKRMDEIMNHPLIKNEPSGPHAKQLRVAIISLHAQLEGDIEEVYKRMKEQMHMWEAKPHLIEENLNAYFPLVLDMATISNATGKPNDAVQLVQKLKKLVETYPKHIHFKHKIAIDEMEIDLYNTRGEYGKSVELVPALVHLAEANVLELDPLEEWFYHKCLFGAYFGYGDFKNAQIYLQKIIHSPHQNIRANSRTGARIINLILQFEQREYVHLGYVLRSTYRYLLKNKSVYRSETVIIDFLKRAIRFSSQKELLPALAEMKSELLKLREDSFENNFLPDFPLIDWIDSKLQNKSLGEINRERYLEALANEESQVITEGEMEGLE